MYKGKNKIKKINLQDMKLTQTWCQNLSHQPLVGGQLQWFEVQLEGVEVGK
jgi:hypothetical protein